ncbi:carboxypeptidase regulatory-like domain-containing protein [Phragmitibacter flavus]|uniref:Carboxypeptidase regulatory-like domain-containing protein n=1 Tax=Phragmitibacter flavus TaxID=2576071 RepID=A0A5R8KFY3_9BACT|nr:carboxypeptidase-like regulatory domain-containing protein [Phragmitibacter flavus]TLD71210.1 carboxypeptidase regulatory-like domain-containing protein [Phragmitibacter flavus]
MDPTPTNEPTNTGCLKWFFSVSALVILCLMLVPNFSWTGAYPLAIHIRVIDATTNRPISGALVTLHPHPPGSLDEMVASSFVRTAKTDGRGRARLKHMFGAGGSTYEISIGVRQSVVSGEATGYLPAKVRISENEQLRFFDTPWIKRQHRTSLVIKLNPE